MKKFFATLALFAITTVAFAQETRESHWLPLQTLTIRGKHAIISLVPQVDSTKCTATDEPDTFKCEAVSFVPVVTLLPSAPEEAPIPGTTQIKFRTGVNPTIKSTD